MDLLDASNLMDVPEVVVAEAGTEMLVSIFGAEIFENKESDKKSLKLSLVPTGEEHSDIETIVDFLSLPDLDQDDDKKIRNKQRRLRDVILKAFQVEPARWKDFTSGVDDKALNGCSCYVVLKTEDDPTYGLQNKVKQYITPRG